MRSRSGMGLITMIAIIAMISVVLLGSVRVFENVSRRTQLRIDKTKAYYLAQAGIVRSIWKWYTDNDATTTNEIQRNWSPINTTIAGTNTLFKTGYEADATNILESNYAYVVPGIAFVKNVATATNTAAGASIVATLGAGVTVPVGDFLVVSMAQDGGATANWACTDNTTGGPNTYTLRSNLVGPPSGTNTNAQVRVLVFSAPVTFAFIAGNTITCSWTTNTTDEAMTVSQFSGVDTFGVQNTGTGTLVGGTQTTMTANATTTVANSLIVGAVAIEGPSTETFTGGTSFLTAPPTRTGTTGGAAADVTINPEYRIVYATGNYTATGANSIARDYSAAVVSFHAANRWFTSGGNRRLRGWQLYNTHSASSITLDKVKISWTPAGAELLNDFVLNGSSRWPGGTFASGSTIDLTNTTLNSGVAWQGDSTYIQWNGALNGGGNIEVTAQFIFSGDSATADDSTGEITMWNGAQTNGDGMPGARALTVTSTGQVNQTTGGYFKVLKTVKATFSGAPATTAAPSTTAIEITDWDEGEKNIP